MAGSPEQFDGAAPGGAPGVVLAMAVPLLAVSFALVVRHRPRRGSSAGGALLLASAAGVAVLASAGAHATAEARGGLDALREERAVVRAVGVLRTDAEVAALPWDASSSRCRAVVAASGVTARGTTRAVGARLEVTAPAPCPGWVRGAVVRIDGRLGETPVQGVSGALSARTVTVLRPAVGVDALVARLRGGLLTASAGLEPQARGLVPGMTIGDTSRVPAEVEQAMLDVGLTHLTAVSGTHVAVVAIVVGAGAAALRAPRTLRAALLATAVGAFVLLVHPEPSVLRAALMGMVGVAGLLAGRGSSALPALAAAVVVLLVVDPALAVAYGFLLSVAATAAIVLLAGPAAAALTALPRWAAQSVSVPLAAQSACGPILVLLDPALSSWAVPANVLAAPAVLPATVLGLLATGAAPLSPTAAQVLAHGSGLATGWIAGVAVRCAALPGARLGWTGGFPGAVALAALTALGWVLVARALRARALRSASRQGARRAWPTGPSFGARAGRRGAARTGIGRWLSRGRLVPCPPPRASPPRRQ
ncbi:ComEC/Rec2 family competence protein [Actinotalea sp.]|uniref:ComEC/Rec2 family competence protein n=1 Tax=Actinotalea sp. TaxID=1872145 RepID=UPI003561B2E9